MKNLKLRGYTNDTAKALCKGIDNCLRFCPASRYKRCCKEKICGRLDPTCVYDQFCFIGKKYKLGAVNNVVTATDETKIKKKLAAAVKRCRPVTVTLTVDA